MERIVVLHSGGLDSTVLIAELLRDFKPTDVVALFVDYGARQNVREMSAVNAQVSTVFQGVRLEHAVVESPWLDSHYMCDPEIVLLKDELSKLGEEVGEEPHIIPQRNLLLLTLAYSLKQYVGAGRVYAAFEQDPGGIPARDTGPQYLTSAAVLLGGESAGLCVPFSGLTKGEIIEHGVKVGAPFDLTWSCYNAFDIPCGACAACAQRRRGFVDARVDDPVKCMDEKSLKYMVEGLKF